MEKPGPTGKFPDGTVPPPPADQGELNLGLAQADGVIYLNFGHPVHWVGMRPEDARSIARKLLELADEAERTTGMEH